MEDDTGLPIPSRATPIIPRRIKPISDPSTLPILLCLHGGGSSSRIYKFQCRRLESLLGPRFRFIYPNAPLPSGPGHGILPVFESVKPYYRWVTDVWGKTPYKQEPPEGEVEMVNRVVDEAVKEAGGEEMVVGVMGFSQGARLAAGMVCREFERRRRRQPQQQSIEKTPGDPKEKGKGGFPSLKFGVTIGGPYPPISLNQATASDGSGKADVEGLKSFPIVHGWGRDDPVKKGCQTLAEVCDSANMFVYEFNGEHHLPLTDWESKELAEMIEEAYFST